MRQAKATSATVDARQYILVSPLIFLQEILPPFRTGRPPSLSPPKRPNPCQSAALRGARAFFQAPNLLPQAASLLSDSTGSNYRSCFGSSITSSSSASLVSSSSRLSSPVPKSKGMQCNLSDSLSSSYQPSVKTAPLPKGLKLKSFTDDSRCLFRNPSMIESGKN
jgi:hypothetical protein